MSREALAPRLQTPTWNRTPGSGRTDAVRRGDWVCGRVVGRACLLALMGLGAVAARLDAADAPSPLTDDQIAVRVATVKQVGAGGEGHPGAVAAMRDLEAIPGEKLPVVLLNFRDADPIAANWLRGLVASLADKAQRSDELPVERLKIFVADTSQDPRARSVAFELLERYGVEGVGQMSLDFASDPSLELRRRGVAALLATASKHLAGDHKDLAKSYYEKALTHARALDQIQAATKELRQLGAEIDLTKHLGFLTTWKAVGPFDNTGGEGFDTVYPPERRIDLDAKYAGMDGETIVWTTVSTDEEYGELDLNETIGKHKGAVAYLTTEIVSDAERPAQIRLGSINAVKVWVNDKPVLSREVYHANMAIDQYIGEVTLKKGKNTILLKVCQNEQTESWAQRWTFQLRVTDPMGAAVGQSK